MRNGWKNIVTKWKINFKKVGRTKWCHYKVFLDLKIQKKKLQSTDFKTFRGYYFGTSSQGWTHNTRRLRSSGVLSFQFWILTYVKSKLVLTYLKILSVGYNSSVFWIQRHYDNFKITKIVINVGQALYTWASFESLFG